MNTPEIKAAAETAKNIISHETYLKMKDDSIILPSEMDKRILSKAREIDRNRYKRKKYIKAAVFFVAFLIIIKNLFPLRPIDMYILSILLQCCNVEIVQK